MLSFATEFPLPMDRSTADFIEAIRSWLLESPHTSLNEEDIVSLAAEGEREIRKGSQSIKVISAKMDNDDVFALKNIALDGEIEWVTDIVYSRRSSDAWVGIRTSRESNAPAVKLPPAKKPRVVLAILRKLGEARDGILKTSFEPILLGNNDIPLASDIVTGEAGCLFL